MINITNAYLWASSEQGMIIDYHTGDLLWTPPLILGDISHRFSDQQRVTI